MCPEASPEPQTSSSQGNPAFLTFHLTRSGLDRAAHVTISPGSTQGQRTRGPGGVGLDSAPLPLAFGSHSESRQTDKTEYRGMLERVSKPTKNTPPSSRTQLVCWGQFKMPCHACKKVTGRQHLTEDWKRKVTQGTTSLARVSPPA